MKPGSQAHFRIIGEKQHSWDVGKLWKLADKQHAESIQIADFPEKSGWFAGLPPSKEAADAAIRWAVGEITAGDMTFPVSLTPAGLPVEQWQWEAIMNACLDFPIILSADGHIMDGSHRMAKAILLGHKTIQAIRFDPTPPPDLILDSTSPTAYLDYLASFDTCNMESDKEPNRMDDTSQ